MKLNNLHVSFYLFVSYLFKINKNYAMLCIEIRKLIFFSMFMDEGILRFIDIMMSGDKLNVSK